MANPEADLLSLREFSLDRRDGETTRTILQDIDLDLPQGSWLAILGRNGSGKSSLLKYLASDESPLTASRAIMFQDPDDQIIASTVARELAMGRREASVAQELEKFGLDPLKELDPRLLSAGQKQRLVLAVTLGQKPQVLFCDEPTSLQDETQAAWVLNRIENWRRETEGTVVTATCDRKEALRADHLVVLEEGRIVLQGPRRENLDHPLVVALLGRERIPGDALASTQGAPPAAAEVPALQLAGVGFRGRGFWRGLAGMNLQLDPGQRLGLTGPNGCGKSTLLAACVGARRPDCGEVRLAGRTLYARKGPDLDHGLALLAPQFPEYLFTCSTVTQELKIDPGLAGMNPAAFLERLGLPREIAGQNPHSLSSGQKRRLALGLVLFSGRQLLLLDEPTAALDRQGKKLVQELLAQVPRETAVLVASHDAEFLANLGCPILDLAPETS